MTARLERLRWWHLDEVVALETELFPEQSWSARTFWSELGQLATRHYVVAVDGERVVGYAGLCDYPDEAWVQTMAVAPAARGSGLGARLLRALLDEAARRGQRTVSLEVRAGNARAQRLYERHGFSRTGVRRGYYQPSGEDAVLMTRRG
ncbi:MAG TPA: ribosomal protein S18-alanine N-acetyltransferase [Mycobacteriales bacterium]|nr:ribosomal protein S18-alanine N-acetyltransferase [Mycobacteriales bacterium]